jgi:hypothetical protein
MLRQSRDLHLFGPASRGAQRVQIEHQCAILSPHSLISALFLSVTIGTAATFSDWQFRQSFEITNTGLTRISLPVETLDAARPDLADLRFADAAENEMPYLIDRPARPAPPVRTARAFQAQLLPDSTLITLETGVTQAVTGITLVTPATDFIKAVQVAGSTDGKAWRDLASGIPIFHQPNGASQLRVDFPAGEWPFLRLTILAMTRPLSVTRISPCREAARTTWPVRLCNSRIVTVFM